YATLWHPLTCLSHMLDCQLFGVNPGRHHLVNVVFHAANAVLVFLLARRLGGRLWPAALVAALFAWHPLRVASVAWIAERKDVLSGFFGLLALLAYLHEARQRAAAGRDGVWQPMPRTLVLFALGVMAKPMLVTLPCVLLLLDFWPLRRMEDLNPARPVF